jgi:hypothetical protein
MAEVRKKKKNALKGKGGLVMAGLVALVGVLFFIEQKAPPPRDIDENPLVSEYVHLRSPDVTRVELKRPAGGFTLVKKDGKWAFEAPGRYRADTDEVNSWLESILEDANVDRPVESTPGSLSDYGLDKPTLELVLTGKGQTRTLQIGKEFSAPGTSSPLHYAREPKDGRMFMLSASQLESIRDKKVDDLRDKSLIAFGETKDVKQVTLVRGDKTVEVRREGDRWRITQPFTAPADRMSVESDLIGQLKSSESESFADDAATDLAKYGLDKPKLTIRVTDNQGIHAVHFGKTVEDGKVYAVRDGEKEVTLVSKVTFDNLNKQATDLRDRQLLSLDRDKITTVELKNTRGTTKLQKTGDGKWNVVTTDGKSKPAKGDVVDRVLDSIVGSASKHVEEAPKDLAKYGLVDPAITVTANEGTGTSQVLTISKKLKDTYYAKGPGTAVFEVQPYVVTDLDVAPAAFEEEDAKKK